MLPIRVVAIPSELAETAQPFVPLSMDFPRTPSWPRTTLHAVVACRPSSQTNTGEFFLPMIDSLASNRCRSRVLSMFMPMLARVIRRTAAFPRSCAEVLVPSRPTRAVAASSLRNMWSTENSSQQSKGFFPILKSTICRYTTQLQVVLLFALGAPQPTEKSLKRFGASLPFFDFHSF